MSTCANCGKEPVEVAFYENGELFCSNICRDEFFEKTLEEQYGDDMEMLNDIAIRGED